MNDLIQRIKKAEIIWICGNGGSAATAEHLTADLIKKGYAAVCLNSNTAVITMIANDYGYEYIFSKQLEALYDKVDLLITISCSGKSPNILKAQLGRTYFDFEVFGEEKDYGALEDKHMKFVHDLVAEL